MEGRTGEDPWPPTSCPSVHCHPETRGFLIMQITGSWFEEKIPDTIDLRRKADCSCDETREVRRQLEK